MSKITESRLGDFGKIFAEIESFQGSCDASWYRGVGDSSHSLIPTIARRNPAPTPEDLYKLEKAISVAFSQKSPPFVKTQFSNEWRSLFYMQHYGIPTRLLDWSESPFVSLYFALSSVRRNEKGQPTTDPALWLCDPISWNRTALSHISFSGGILDETCEEVKAYSPSADVEQRAVAPIMVFGTHNSPRIVAQRGVFALFGKGTKGMESIFSDGSYAKGSLRKIIIPKENVDGIQASLYRKGIAESTIYPDLFGLALEIKRNYGFH